MKKVLTVMGTRPEIIKLAPVIKALSAHDDIESITLSTGQHRELADQFFKEFDIKPDIDLNIMKPDQSLGYIVSRMAENFEPVLRRIGPDLVLVQGDTSTAFVGGLIAYYHKIAVGHVEAGLRTYNPYFPHPEEINRQLLSRFATFNFVPTLRAQHNLQKEMIDPATIHYVGNTVVDSLNNLIKSNLQYFEDDRGKGVDQPNIILVTAHRRENFGLPMENICNAIKELSGLYENVKFIFPVHPNPNVRKTVYGILSNNPCVDLTEPMNYLDLIKIIFKSKIILTDSGGIQEEAPTFNKPVLVMRNETERPEGVEAGITVLVGTDKDNIIRFVGDLLTDKNKYQKISKIKNPYGDGKSSQRIVNILRAHLGLPLGRQVEPLADYYKDTSTIKLT